MKFRYKDTREEFIPHPNEVLSVNENGEALISKPYIGDEIHVVSVASNLEVCGELD